MVLKTTEMLWESDIVRCYQRHYHCFKCMPFHKRALWCKMACALWQWTCKRISWFTATRCYHPGHSLDNWHGTSPYIIPVFCANHSTWPLQLSPSLSWKCESCSSVPLKPLRATLDVWDEPSLWRSLSIVTSWSKEPCEKRWGGLHEKTCDRSDG